MNNNSHPATPQLKKINKKHKVVKVIAIVTLVILLMVSVGYAVYVWQQNLALRDDISQQEEENEKLSKENAELRESVDDTEEGEKQDSSGGGLKIGELGIVIDTSSLQQHLRYTIEEYDGVRFARLGTVETQDTCNDGYLGVIRRLAGTIPDDTEPFSILDENGNRVEYLLKQFDGYYLQHRPAQNPCELNDGEFFPDKSLNLSVIRAVRELTVAQ